MSDTIRLNTDKRRFTFVYWDCIESPVLEDCYEKMLFIALKKHADINEECFPGIKLLAKEAGMSERKVQSTLKILEKKNIIKIERRFNENGSPLSNLYTLYDTQETWSLETEEQKVERMIAELQARGYTIKEKESTPEVVNKGADSKSIATENNNPKFTIRQEEQYSLEYLKEIYDYDVILFDKLVDENSLDAVINILHNTLNTTKATIRVCGENKPAEVVKGKLLKLTYPEIVYAVKKYDQITTRINNVMGYMLTILYQAPEQHHLDISNQVNHDLNHLPTTKAI